MKNNWFLNLFVLVMLGMGAASSSAQGLLVLKKDGSKIDVPYNQMDCVTVYEGNPDEVEGYIPQKLGKKLVAMREDEVTFYDGDRLDYQLHEIYTYDDNGRLKYKTAYENEGDEYIVSSTYGWSWVGNLISCTDYLSNFEVKGDKVSSWILDNEKYTYKYDGAGQLVECFDKEDYYARTLSFEWKDGRPIRFVEDYADSSEEDSYYQVEYSGKTCKGYFPFFYSFFVSGDVFSVHPDLAGKIVNQLPSKIIFTDSYKSEGVFDFSYEFDKDGYVVKCVVKSSCINKNPNSMSEKQESTLTFIYCWN